MSLKPGLPQPRKDAVAGFLGAELRGKAVGIEEGRKAHCGHALARGILGSTQLGIGGGEERMDLDLREPPGVACRNAVAGRDRFGVTAEEVICHA